MMDNERTSTTVEEELRVLSVAARRGDAIDPAQVEALTAEREALRLAEAERFANLRVE